MEYFTPDPTASCEYIQPWPAAGSHTKTGIIGKTFGFFKPLQFDEYLADRSALETGEGLALQVGVAVVGATASYLTLIRATTCCHTGVRSVEQTANNLDTKQYHRTAQSPLQVKSTYKIVPITKYRENQKSGSS